MLPPSLSVKTTVWALPHPTLVANVSILNKGSAIGTGWITISKGRSRKGKKYIYTT